MTAHTRPMFLLNPQNSMSRPMTSLTSTSLGQSARAEGARAGAGWDRTMNHLERAPSSVAAIACTGGDPAGSGRPTEERRRLVLENAEVGELRRIELGPATELDDLAVHQTSQRE